MAEDAVFALHVVAAWGKLAERGAAEDGRRTVQFDEVVQIGKAAFELPGRRIERQAHAQGCEPIACSFPGQRNCLLGGA